MLSLKIVQEVCKLLPQHLIYTTTSRYRKRALKHKIILNMRMCGCSPMTFLLNYVPQKKNDAHKIIEIVNIQVNRNYEHCYQNECLEDF